MHMHNALAQRSFHIESEFEVFSAPLVRLLSATDEAIAR
jgi:hypothetical protein